MVRQKKKKKKKLFFSTWLQTSLLTAFAKFIAYLLDGFVLNTIHKISFKEKKLWAEPGLEAGAAGWEGRMLPLCYAVPP